MITDPTELFKALDAGCLDPETGKPTDLPAATTKTIYELLEDDDPNEAEGIRGMIAIAAKRLRQLDEIIRENMPLIALAAKTTPDTAKKLEAAGYDQ
jgi:hypothetical protein